MGVKHTNEKLKYITLTSSFCMLLLGLMVVIGWIFHITPLIQINEKFVPMVFNVGLSFLLFGLIFILYVNKFCKLALVLNFLIFMLSLASILQYFLSIDLHIDQLFINAYIIKNTPFAGRMAVNTGVCLMLASISFYLAANSSQKYYLYLLALIFTSLFFGIAVAGSMGYFFKIRSAYSWGNFSSMSVHAAFGIIFLSVSCFSFILLKMKQVEIEYSQFFPYLTGFIFILITILISQSFYVEQSFHLNQLAQTQMDSISNIINIQIKDRVLALNRMANRFKSNSRKNKIDWLKDANNYIADQEGYEAIEYINSSFKIDWVAPENFNKNLTGFDLPKELSRKSVLETAIKTKSVILSPIVDLVMGGKGVLIISPVFEKMKFNGLFLAVINPEKLLSSLLSSSKSAFYAFTISADGNVLYSYNRAKATKKNIGEKTKEINLYGQTWTVNLWPTDDLIKITDPITSKFIIMFGFLVSLILGVLVHVYQKLKIYLKKMEEIKKSLESANDNLSGIISGIPDLVVAIDSDYKLIAFNDIFQKIFTRDFLKPAYHGMNLKEVLSGGKPFHKNLLSLWERTLSGEVFTKIELVGEGQNAIPLEINSSNILNKNNVLIGGCHISKDITKKLIADEKLRSAKEDLEISVRELNIYNQIILELNEIVSHLQSAKSLEEFFKPVKYFCSEILFFEGGAFFIASDDNEGFFKECVDWGEISGNTLPSKDNCWALRESKLHIVKMNDSGFLCDHSIQNNLSDKFSTICIPLQSQGETIGLLYLVFAKENFEKINKKLFLAKLLAEQLSTSLANQKLKTQLHQQSISDSLTGLYNRRFIEESLNQSISRFNRSKTKISFSVVIIDIDHFKKINDTYGHLYGDYILKKVANLLKENIRNTDVISRWGGEEFIIYFHELSMNDSLNKMELIRKKIEIQDYKNDSFGSVVKITISSGIAEISDKNDTLEKIIEAADSALYKAKASGRNRSFCSE